MLTQAFVPEFAIEVLEKRILGRFSRLNEPKFYPSIWTKSAWL